MDLTTTKFSQTYRSTLGPEIKEKHCTISYYCSEVTSHNPCDLKQEKHFFIH